MALQFKTNVQAALLVVARYCDVPGDGNCVLVASWKQLL